MNCRYSRLTDERKRWAWIDFANTEEMIHYFCKLSAENARSYQVETDEIRHYDFTFRPVANTVLVQDYFHEDIVEYRVETIVTPINVESTAELSPFLRVAEELQAEFGGLRK